MSLSQQIYNGAINLRWGLGATTVTVTGCTGTFSKLTSKLSAEVFELRDQRNSVISRVDNNPIYKGTITFWASDATTPNAGNAAIVMPNPGTLLTVVTATGSPLGAIKWIADDMDSDEEFSKAAECTLNVTGYPLIQA